jgi:hypothetical protein
MGKNHSQRLFLILFVIVVALLTAQPVRAVRFSHIIHEREGLIECLKCHLTGAVNIIPERTICYDCHDEESIRETVLGPSRTHTPLWVNTHGLESEFADAQCSRCHHLSFCVDCHKGGELNADLKKRTVRMDTAPATHTARFRIVHPLKAAAEQIEQCYTCHSRQECVDCHDNYRSRFPNREIVSHQMNWQALIARNDVPDHNAFSLNQCQDCHPGGALSDRDWSNDHAREARRSLAGCQSCHPEGTACMPCHSATSGLMINPHPRNWKSIQSKFRRASPEVCIKCH